MKELNGRKIPECRVDEIRLSADELNRLNDQTKGMIDPNIITTAMLSEINTSVALLVDIASNLLNRLVAAEKNAEQAPVEKEQ